MLTLTLTLCVAASIRNSHSSNGSSCGGCSSCCYCLCSVHQLNCAKQMLILAAHLHVSICVSVRTTAEKLLIRIQCNSLIAVCVMMIFDVDL